MNLLPLYESGARANELIKHGDTVFQLFLCSGCGVKQTMPDANTFYTKGRCEECGHITDIEKDGCNFMAVTGSQDAVKFIEGLLNGG